MRRRRRLRKAELGKWDSSYPDASPKRPVKVNYPWFTDHSGRPYFAKPDPRIFDPDLVTPELQHHAMGIWEGYQTMRLTKLPGEYGLGRTGLPFEKYAVIYQKQADLGTPEMDELWHYMMGVRWVTSTAYKSWRDLLKSNELTQVRTPKWHTDRKPAPPEVTIARARRRRAAVEIIDIGPTTVRDEIYDMVDQAMTAVANLTVEGFRLGRYNIKYDGSGWQVSDYQTGQEIDWYPDEVQTTYDMVDDWNNDVWTKKNETPYGF